MKTKKSVAKSGKLDPCFESREALKKYQADIKAGHKDAEGFWLGQAQAFGSMCTEKSIKNGKKRK